LLAQGFTAPIPANPVGAADRVGPAAPCKLASKIVTKVLELFSALSSTWIAQRNPFLGGYTTQAVVNCNVVVSPMVITTAASGGANSYNLVANYVANRLGSYYTLDRESCGRIFCYSCRYTVFENDQWPAVQSFSGNSPAVNALVDQTSLSGDSMFSRQVQADMTAHNVDEMEAVRAFLGRAHFNLVKSFSGERHTVPVAVLIVRKSKALLITSPYHSPISASLTDFNSPSLWDSFWNVISDVGERVARIGGTLVGTALGGAGFLTANHPGMTNRLLVQQQSPTLVPKTLTIHPAIKPLLGLSRASLPHLLSTADEAKKRKAAVTVANKYLAIMNGVKPVHIQAPLFAELKDHQQE